MQQHRQGVHQTAGPGGHQVADPIAMMHMHEMRSILSSSVSHEVQTYRIFLEMSERMAIYLHITP